MKIYLIGYMGCGKSTFGKSIAEALGLEWVDLDMEFESRYKISIQDFFSKYGESAFRELEHKLLLEFSKIPDQVISTGGGLPCYFENMQLMNQTGITVYLKADADLIITRLKHTGNMRPLFRSMEGENLHENITTHITSREKFYNRAQIIVDAANTNPEDLKIKLGI